MSALLIILAINFTPTDDSQLSSQLDKYIAHWMSNVRVERYEKAKKFIPFIIISSKKFEQDPWLVAATIARESSFKPDVIGKARNETGLMQCHGKCAKGFDISQPEGQIDAGTHWLKIAIKKCGGIESGINAYRTGKCGPILESSTWRYGYYLKIKRIFGGE